MKSTPLRSSDGRRIADPVEIVRRRVEPAPVVADLPGDQVGLGRAEAADRDIRLAPLQVAGRVGGDDLDRDPRLRLRAAWRRSAAAGRRHRPRWPRCRSALRAIATGRRRPATSGWRRRPSPGHGRAGRGRSASGSGPRPTRSNRTTPSSCLQRVDLPAERRLGHARAPAPPRRASLPRPSPGRPGPGSSRIVTARQSMRKCISNRTNFSQFIVDIAWIYLTSQRRNTQRDGRQDR